MTFTGVGVRDRVRVIRGGDGEGEGDGGSEGGVGVYGNVMAVVRVMAMVTFMVVVRDRARVIRWRW